MTDARLRGRTKDLSHLHAAPDGVVYILGDSGIGKSELLTALGTGWTSRDAVAFPAILGSLAGSLQGAIADAVGDSLAEYSDAEDTILDRIRHGFGSLLDRATVAGSREMTQLLVSRAITAVEAKLGTEVAESLRSALKGVLLASEEDLRARIQQLSAPDMATTLLAYITEVADITARRLIFRFDGGELLTEVDMALLGELASRSVSEFLLFVTMNSDFPGLSPRLAILDARGAIRHNLASLSTPDIQEWLASASVPAEVWPTFIRTSAGYPFFIEELITLHNADKLGDAVAVPPGFNSLLQETWTTLDHRLQLTATALACFPEPPSSDFLSRLVGVSKIEWMTIRRALLDSRVFVTRPDGSVWFHDRRRAFIWNEILDADARSVVADAALDLLRSVITDQSIATQWILEALPHLMSAGAPSVVDDPYLSQIGFLVKDELAILFALIELTQFTSDEGRSVETTLVGRFALSRLGRPIDSISALESLANRGFVLSKSNRSASVSVVIIPSQFAFVALIAQIASVLQRNTVPMIGLTTFDQSIRPLLGSFELAVISVGDGSLRAHRDAFEKIRVGQIEKRDISRSPSLGVNYVVGSQRISATVTFATTEHRDAAEVALHEHVPDTDSNAVHIDNVDRLLPSRIRLGRMSLLLRQLVVDLPSSTILEHVERVVENMETVRLLLSPLEASAVDWRQPRSALLDVADSDSSWADVRIRGGEEATVRRIVLPDRHGLMADPLIELKLRRDGFIDHDHAMDGWSIHAGAKLAELPPPWQEVLDELDERTRSFNRGLARVIVPVDARRLEQLILSERNATYDSLTALVRAGISDQLPPVDDSSLHIFLYPLGEDSLFPGMWMAYALTSDDHNGNVVVRILAPGEPHPPLFTTADDCLRFGLPPHATHKTSTDGQAEGVLAPLLGWSEDDIRLDRPSRREKISKHSASEPDLSTAESDQTPEPPPT